jgi:hypothetical protein
LAWCIAAAVALGVVGLPRRALAAPEPVRLVWVRGEHAEACSDGPTMASAVSSRLGETVFSDAAKRSIEGFIERVAGRWTARIYEHTASGQLVGSRELSSDAADCAPIESAVTLAIALAIDPDAALRPAGSSPAASRPVSPAAPLPPAASCPPCPAPVCPAPAPCPMPLPCPTAKPCPRAEASRAVTTATVSLRGVLAGGLLPSASAGAEVAGDVSVSGAVHATVGALLLPEVRTALADLSFGLTAVWAGACVDGWGGRWGGTSLCATAMLGAIHAVVYVLEPTTPGQQLWAGVGVTPKIRVHLVGPLVWEAGGELIVPVTRQEFTVGGRPGVAFQESAVAGVGFMGLGWSIP